MKLNKHAPIIKNYTRSTITEMANINRVKIIDMTIYHKPFNLVKRFVKNFTISTLGNRLPNAFILYYGKAIKNESILTPPLGG